MTDVDLLKTISETISRLKERGEPASLTTVLETLGLAMLPSLHSSDSVAEEVSPAAEGEGLVSLGRFQLLGQLGCGGMGRVLEARDPEIRRKVAVKVVIDPSRVTETQLARFVAEAQVTGQLQHPNIVPVYDMGFSEQGQVYFVMKKVEGRSLREVLAALREGDEASVAEWTRTKLLHALIQICNAMAYAHDRGVLHRDLKPDNIMLGPFGEVMLMDWGVARLMGEETAPVSPEGIDRLTMAPSTEGDVIGTPGFMSPEQLRGQMHLLDGRSDVWSLGAILYELLTLERAYQGQTLYAVVHATMSGLPVDPRERAPERTIPDELAAVCLRALASEPDDRFGTVAELAEALEAFLEGSKRRAAALRYVVAAEEAWESYGALANEREDLLAREQALDAALKPWASLEEKADLLAVRRRLSALSVDRVDRFSEVLAACEQALSQDPENLQAPAVLARAHYARFEAAEAARDEEDLRYHERRVRLYDDGRYAPLLKGTGSLTLRTDPAGAEVLCERYDRSADLVWPLVERRVLGTTPLEDFPMEQGSYLLTLRAPGKRDTRYPVFIPRGRHWDSGEQPLPLYSDAAIGEGVVYVPSGPFVYGGDDQCMDSLARSEPKVEGFFLSVLPVTMQQYCEFVTDLAQRDPEEAWSRVPRHESGIKSSGGQYWERAAPGAPYRVPEVDRDGDTWDPLWPVGSVSWEDAVAYAQWRSEQSGIPWSLPTEQQWEKAARGVDGRIFPWGDRFDPTLCKMRQSREGAPQPEAVGVFPTDISPYGVRDLAGSVRDMCGDPGYGGDSTRHPVRGGSWSAQARLCRAANRIGYAAWVVSSNRGFRLVRALDPTRPGPRASGRDPGPT